MCEVAKGQRRTFRDQDPPRICQRSADSLEDEAQITMSAPNSQGILQRAASLDKCFGETELVAKDRVSRGRERGDSAGLKSGSSDSARGGSAKGPDAAGQLDLHRRSTATENFLKELADKVPSSARRDEVITNGLKSDADSCDGLTNGRNMAPVLGVPPPPPPAPHMGPDGLILPRKPYNPYLTSNNHKDLRRELLFNQKVGRSVLNQKSELQRALEKQREAASRREAERNRDESYKDDPRTALQRALEQRAKHIEMALEQSQPTMEQRSNLLVTARAKLRPRTDSQ